MPHFKKKQINPFYSNISIDKEWKDFSEQSDLVLWKPLTDNNTDNNARESKRKRIKQIFSSFSNCHV